MTMYHAFQEIDSGTAAAIIETGYLNLDRQILTGRPELVARVLPTAFLLPQEMNQLLPLKAHKPSSMTSVSLSIQQTLNLARQALQQSERYQAGNWHSLPFGKIQNVKKPG